MVAPMTDAPGWDRSTETSTGPDPATPLPIELPTAAQLDEFEADLDRVDVALAELDDEH